MKRLQLALIHFFLLTPIISYAANYGFNLTTILQPSNPVYLHGYQFFIQYDPQRFKWREFNIYFDAGYGHFWATNNTAYRHTNILSIAPVIRNTFKSRGLITPYIEFSIGFAYTSHIHIDDRNLGMHFVFQDRLGVGLLLGSNQQVSVGIHALHYSNAGLSRYNSGLTAPLMLDVGYRF